MIAVRSSFSKIRHPTGASSTGISFLALTDFSQSVDPLELRRRAIGLLRVKGICLVSLSALFTAFAVAVCEYCIGGDKAMSSGTKSFNKTVMFSSPSKPVLQLPASNSDSVLGQRSSETSWHF